jgi:hypothetical protein
MLHRQANRLFQPAIRIIMRTGISQHGRTYRRSIHCQEISERPVNKRALTDERLVNSTNIEQFAKSDEAGESFIPNDLPAPYLVGERGFEPPAPTSRT